MNGTNLMLASAAALAATATLAQAQTAATPPAAAPPPSLWKSSASLGMTLTRGNSETLLLTSNVQTARKWDKNELAFGASGTYGEDDGERNAASANVFGQYNLLLTERLYLYGRVDAVHDAVADVKYRLTVSPGAGYYFIKTAKTSLSAEVGPGYVFEKIGDDEEDYLTLRVGERFEHQLTTQARIWQSAEYLPQVEDFGNYVVIAEIGVETGLSKNLSLRTYLQDTYRSEPAPGRKSNDLKLVTAIAYKF